MLIYWTNIQPCEKMSIGLMSYTLELLDKIIYPIIADITEPIITDRIDTFINSGIVNESFEINIDIVNPIPAINPIPKICFRFAPSGNTDIPSLTAIYTNPKMPIDLPNNNPNIIPKLIVDDKLEIAPASNIIAVLTNAKIGKIR